MRFIGDTPSMLVFFSTAQRAGQRAWMDTDSKALLNRFADIRAGWRIRGPLLHEIQDLVGALMRTLRASRARQEAYDALFRKNRLGHIECLPAHAESGGHIGYGLPINLAPPQHLVAHLHQITGIKKLVLLEHSILHFFRVRVKGSMLAENTGLGIDSPAESIRFYLLHMCQVYYVLKQMKVKPKMQEPDHRVRRFFKKELHIY
jgi:hypothetical protein